MVLVYIVLFNLNTEDEKSELLEIANVVQHGAN